MASTYEHESSSNENSGAGSSPTRRGATTMMEKLALAEGLATSRVVEPAPRSCDSDISVTTKSIASSSALVGETILETTSQRYPPSQNAKMKLLLEQQQQNSSSTTNWGLSEKMNAGLEWIQRKRQERQQAALAQQVAEQERILYEAQEAYAGFTSPEKQSDTPNTNVSTSCSGSGMSVNLATATARTKSTEEDHHEEDHEEEEEFCVKVRYVKEPLEAPPFLLNPQVMQLLLEQALPPSIAYAQWKRIYCLARDGDDFGEFLRKCDKQTHTLLVVQTTRSEIFGAYVESPWTPHHEGFYGLGQACLFQVNENETSSSPIRVYKWTGANRYIQVCDASSRMICVGGGGDSFGLCLEQDFSVGSTGPCDTFCNEPLCAQENFQILNMEVYGFLLGQF